MPDKSIIKLVGASPGKTVAVFAGVHGNELVGVRAIRKVSKEVQIKAGTVYFVYANPLAISKRKRLVNKNLNRLFFKKNKGRTFEDKRARKLIKILDKCDALLDIHSYNSKTGDQFAIGEPNTNILASKMNFPYLLSGFSKMGHGTDGYMHSKNKVGLCIECGTSNKSQKFQPLAERSIYQFLQYFGSIDKFISNDKVRQRHLRARKLIIKRTRNFKFLEKFKDFDKLKNGKVFATDGKHKHVAGKSDYILFPREKVKIGGEVCIVIS